MIYKILEDNRVIAVCQSLFETNKVINAMKFFQEYNDEEPSDNIEVEKSDEFIDHLFSTK